MQNPNNVKNFFVHQVINSDGFKPTNWPRAQILQLCVIGKIARTDNRILAQQVNGVAYGISKANRDLWNVYDSEVIAELSNEVIPGGLSV
jgi:hypothetical protein